MNYRSFVPRFFCILAIFCGTFTFSVDRVRATGDLPVFDKLNVVQNTISAVNNVQSVIKEMGLDGVAKMIAQQFVKQITKSIVTWINSGFDGNPSFVTDPQGFFQNVGDQVTGEFLSKTGLDFLCEPFRFNLRLSLVVGVNTGKNGYKNQYKCTLSGVIKNVESFDGFMKGQFSQNGGWKSWFQITQNNSNNPIGAYIGVKGAMEAKIGDKKLVETKKLDWGKGFLSWETCDQTYKEALDQSKTNPISTQSDASLYNKVQELEAKVAAAEKKQNSIDAVKNPGGYSQANREYLALRSQLSRAQADFNKQTEATRQDIAQSDIIEEAKRREANASVVQGPTQDGGNAGDLNQCAKKSTKTPGSVIESQLNQVLPKELEGIVTADEINEIVSALASQLLTQAVTGFQGLAGTTAPKGGSRSFIDNYADESNPRTIANLRRQIEKQIKRAYNQLGNTRYVRMKRLSLGYIKEMEEAQTKVVACYAPKITGQDVDSLILARFEEASSTLASDIVPLRMSIEKDILEAEDRSNLLRELETDLSTAETPEELERIQNEVQDISESVSDAEGQKNNLEDAKEDVVLQAKADLESC